MAGQVNALNRLKNILPLKTKEALYRAFILPHFDYCSQIWHHCGERNTTKMQRVNQRALRYVYKDKVISYEELLDCIALHTTLKSRRRTQDMLLTVDNCFQNKAPRPIADLVQQRRNDYNLRGNNKLSLPKINSTKHGLKSFRYFAAKTWNALPDAMRAKAGTITFFHDTGRLKFIQNI